MTFWIVLGLMAAAAVVWVVFPLMRPGKAPVSSRAYDMEVYRDQLRELDRDLERGVIGPEEAAAARREIERRLLAADARDETPRTPARTRSRAVALVVGILVPAAAFAVYDRLGSPGMPDEPFAARQAEAGKAVSSTRRAAEERVAALQKRLEDKPKDLAAWIEIARVYRSLERYADAARAFGRARDLVGDQPILLSAYGEALTFAADGVVTKKAVEAFEKALAAAPDDPRAQYYLGLARAQQGDARGALDMWSALEAQAPADASWLPALRDRMREVADQAGIDLAAVRRARGKAAAGASGPSAADMAAAQAMRPEERSRMIRTMVERLAARLKENPDDAAGWRRLARSYRVLGEREKAAAALARAEAAEKKRGAAGKAEARADDKGGAAAGLSASEEQRVAIRAMVARLAARMAKNPNDLEGWRRLGRSYMVLGETGRAADAYARAAALAPKDVDVLVDYGQALLADADGAKRLPPRFIKVMRDVLALDRENPVALWYLGRAESEAGNGSRAAALWRRLLDRLPPDAPERAMVEQHIRALSTDGG